MRFVMPPLFIDIFLKVVIFSDAISAYKTPSVEFIKSLEPALLHTSAFRVTVLPLVGMYDVAKFCVALASHCKP